MNIEQVPLREFQLHPTKYLKKLPIVLTRYNVAVACVNPIANASVNTIGTVLTEPLTKKKDAVTTFPKPIVKPIARKRGELSADDYI